MTTPEIRLRRLVNQQIAKTAFARPEEIVQWMGAMQAQDFGMAKWAIGLRLPGSKDKEIEEAFNQGRILRTHLLRPTWHFVTPADIKWLLQLTAPKILARNKYYLNKSGLDKTILKRTNDFLAKELEGGHFKTRTQLQQTLAKKKIKADGMRLAYIMMQAELDGIICSGPRIGNQFSYALLDERAPTMERFNANEAVGKLMNRFFESRGPATLHDFVYWSNLSMKEAKEGFELLDKRFITEQINGHEHFFIPSDQNSKKIIQNSFLMPDYDEYGMSYKDKSFMLDKKSANDQGKGTARLPHLIIMNGVVAGTWTFIKKTEGRNKVVLLEYNFPTRLSTPKQKAISQVEQRYRSFTET